MKAVIIGSGISGLTAALYLLKDGHEVTILEQYHETGGVTAAIKKDGYTWELGQLILEGLGPEEQIGFILKDLGIHDSVGYIKNDRIYSFPDMVIRKPESYQGPWWRKEYLKKLFPEDAEGLDRFYRMYVRFMEIITLARRSERAKRLLSLFFKCRLYIKLVPLLPKIRWSARTLMDRLFTSEKLRAVFMSILADFVVRPTSFPGLGIPAVNPEPAFDCRVPLVVSGTGRQPSYQNIEGGVNALISVMTRRIIDQGGTIRTGISAVAINIENGTVNGVRCGDGSLITADHVLASGGAKETFFDLVGSNNLPPSFSKLLEDIPLMESVFMVHLGVDYDPTVFIKGNLCYYYQTYDLEKGIDEILNGIFHEGRDGFLVYVPSAHTPTMAPPGHHAVTVYTIAPNRLTSGTWDERKEEFYEKLLSEAEKYIPGLKEHVKTRIILTPDDFRRRTHLKHHAFGGCSPVMGWKGIPHKTPVKNLWFIGAQSASGAGINNVMEGSWRCIRMIRKSLK